SSSVLHVSTHLSSPLRRGRGKWLGWMPSTCSSVSTSASCSFRTPLTFDGASRFSLDVLVSHLNCFDAVEPIVAISVAPQLLRRLIVARDAPEYVVVALLVGAGCGLSGQSRLLESNVGISQAKA